MPLFDAFIFAQISQLFRIYFSLAIVKIAQIVEDFYPVLLFALFTIYEMFPLNNILIYLIGIFIYSIKYIFIMSKIFISILKKNRKLTSNLS